MALGVHFIDLALWLVEPQVARLLRAEFTHHHGRPVEDAAALSLALDDVACDIAVSWKAPRRLTEITLEVEAERGRARWENVDGSFFRFRVMRGDTLVVERETTLREDTLSAFRAALADPVAAPLVDTRVYDLLDRAYGR
jgi:predicted dehydrogenase